MNAIFDNACVYTMNRSTSCTGEHSQASIRSIHFNMLGGPSLKGFSLVLNDNISMISMIFLVLIEGHLGLGHCSLVSSLFFTKCCAKYCEGM